MRRPIYAEDLADCGKDVDMTDILVNLDGLLTRDDGDQGNPESAVVGKIAVSGFPMLAQGFSVVSCQYDQRIFVEPLILDIIEQLAQRKINIGHLAVIGSVSILRFERLWRLITLMRVETMDPEEPPAVLDFEPSQGIPDDGLGFSFDVGKFLRRARSVIVVVDVESLGESEPGIKGEGSDKSSGGVAVALQMLRQSQKSGADNKIVVIMDSVINGHRSEKDIGMGGESCRCVGERSGKESPSLSQAVDIGRLDQCIPKTTEPVRPQSIDGDEENVELALGRLFFGKLINE
jgi:hypothetical protein